MKFQLAALGLFALLSAQHASAATTVPDFAVTCASGVQLCEPAFSVSVQVPVSRPPVPIQLKYDVRDTHCSSVRLHIFLDGALVQTTGYLGWHGAEAPYDALPLSTGYITLSNRPKPGTHVVSVNAEGQEGGCNSGQLYSWGGALEVLP